MNNEPIVFLHIPKTGGIAVRKAMRTAFGRRLNVLVHRGKTKLSLPQRVEALGLESKPVLISVVRNPTERLVSAYWYLRNGGSRHTRRDAKDYERVFGIYDTFEEFVMRGGLDRFYFDQVHLKPQSFWLRDEARKKGREKFKICPDLKIFKYEEMNVRLALFLSKQSGRNISFGVANATKDKPKTVVTPEMQDVIDSIYAQDLELWKSL